jgi:biotin carboxyl carrier protein
MSKRQVKVILNDKTYEVEIADLNACPMNVAVNGKEYQVTVEAAAPENIPMPVAKKVEAPVAANLPRPAAAQAVADTGNEVRSPMPGKVLEVLVKPGQKVSAKQQLCSLEAMKMKSAIRANRDAVIASVEVTNGQKVGYGDILFRYE